MSTHPSYFVIMICKVEIFYYGTTWGTQVNIELSKRNSIEILNFSDDNMDAKLVVIDYEFCSYNYRAFDIANHFQEWMYDYTNKSYPYYYIAKDKFPSKETRVRCFISYLKTYFSFTIFSLSF